MSESGEKTGNVNVKKNNVKTRRGYKGKYTIQNKVRIIGANASGISSKLSSLDYIIKENDPGIICLQETKLRKMGKLNTSWCKKYTTFELVRRLSHGGGLATMVKPELDPVWIAEGDDLVEILVIEVRIKEMKIRIINGYGPQESDSIERKNLFWSRLNSEVVSAMEADAAVLIEMDGNLHCGRDIITGDPNKINNNGKMFSTFLEENPDLYLLNSCHAHSTGRLLTLIGDRTILNCLQIYFLRFNSIQKYHN